MKISHLLGVAMVGSWLTGTVAMAADGPPCDRACLEDYADTYLKALTSGNPSALAMDKGVIFTENTVRLNIGQGLWNRADGMGPFKVVVVDVPAQQVALIASISEQGVTRLLGARLRISLGKVIEIETIVARTGMTPIPLPQELNTRPAPPIFAEALKAAERRSRSELTAAANQYFEGIEQNSGAIVPFDASCNRVENGIQTTNNTTLAPPGADGKQSPMALGCRDQFNAGGMFWTLPERRVWAVDEERGLVIGAFTFRSELPQTASVGPAPALGPMMAHNTITELFKIKNGRICQIEAVLGPMLPYGQRSGW